MFSVLTLTVFALLSSEVYAQDHAPLRLVQTIPMPNVKGRIDHMDAMSKANDSLWPDSRMFTRSGRSSGGKWLKSIPGFKKTQGVAYVLSLNKVFVASGDDGMLRVFRGDTLDLLDDQAGSGTQPCRVRSSPQLLYVGYGGKDAGKDNGEVGIIEPISDKHLGDVKVEAHPAELLLDESGNTLFVLFPLQAKFKCGYEKTRGDVHVACQQPAEW